MEKSGCSYQGWYNGKYAYNIKWLAKDNEDIYVPDYNDMLRVAFMYSFDRAKLSDLVSLLSGRDFETREFREEIGGFI